MMIGNDCSRDEMMSLARPILIVESDDSLRAVLIDHLTATKKFQPLGAATLREAAYHLDVAKTRFDTIFLNVALPDGDGSAFCLHLRRRGHKMPVIILGNRACDEDVVRGLDAGANDFITDTSRLNELSARLRVQLRLFDNSVDAIFIIGSYTFRHSAKLLVHCKTERRIFLTNKEADLLKFLYINGCFARRQTLLSEVWGYAPDVPSTTLDTHIYTLRRKIRADRGYSSLLMTVPGGYQLALPS